MTGDPVRDEAERLVAAALAAVSLAARGLGAAGSARRTGRDEQSEYAGFATGSPECCICPVCRAIAAVRDPSPDLAERLAAGAGDLAAGVASLLRAFGRGERHGEHAGGGGWPWAADEPDEEVADPWRAATAAPAPEPKPMAKKAIKKVAKKAAAKKTSATQARATKARSAEASATEASATEASAGRATAKKASARKAPAKGSPARKAGPAPDDGGGA